MASNSTIELNQLVFLPGQRVAVSPRPTSSTPALIVEAQGWVIDANGNDVVIKRECTHSLVTVSA